MKLNDEEQCMLSLMEISGFPVQIKHGFFTWDDIELGFPHRMGPNSARHATAEFSKVVNVFEFWKRHHGKC